MIGKLATGIAKYIYTDNNKYNLSFARTQYTLHVLLNFLFVLLFLLVISFFIGNTTSVILCFICFVALRLVSGGAWHFKNDFHCFIFSTLVLILIPLIELYNIDLSFLNVITAVIILYFAPLSKSITRFSKKYWTFKSIALLFIAFNYFVLISPVVTTAFFIQALSLLDITKMRVNYSGGS
ncbi:accessory gene regulator B family protein [Paenibacillus filicis]|uniref:accessory gene regulator B family protein n=1 Tax=Paenibacillus filicis TaxID=669464 RepID=UPI003BF98F71